MNTINNAHTFIDGWILPKLLYIDIGTLYDGTISIELMLIETDATIGVIDIFDDAKIAYAFSLTNPGDTSVW